MSSSYHLSFSHPIFTTSGVRSHVSPSLTSFHITFFQHCILFFLSRVPVPVALVHMYNLLSSLISVFPSYFTVPYSSQAFYLLSFGSTFRVLRSTLQNCCSSKNPKFFFPRAAHAAREGPGWPFECSKKALAGRRLASGLHFSSFKRPSLHTVYIFTIIFLELLPTLSVEREYNNGGRIFWPTDHWMPRNGIG